MPANCAAITVQLLTQVEHDSSAAALTTSLPERIGGDRNYDYCIAWVRDASLSLALLARLGKVDEVQHYFDWLCGLDSATDAPLRVCYRLGGSTWLDELELSAVRGYATAGRYAMVIAPPSNASSGCWPSLPTARAFTSRTAESSRTSTGNCSGVQPTTLAGIRIGWSGTWELSVEAHYVAKVIDAQLATNTPSGRF